MSVNSLGYLSGLTTDFTNVRAMGDFAVDGVLTVENFSANSFIGMLSANTINAESGNTVEFLGAISTNTLTPGSGNTLTVSNGASLVQRSIDSGGRHFDLRAFGVSPASDGTTIRLAIVSALSAMHSLGGGTVYVPEGTWDVRGTPIVLPGTGLRVVGAGMDKSILSYSNTTGAVFQLGSYDGAKDFSSTPGAQVFTVEEITFRGTYNNTTSSGRTGTPYAIIDYEAGHVRVNRVRFQGFYTAFWGIASDFNVMQDIMAVSNGTVFDLRNRCDQGVYIATKGYGNNVYYSLKGVSSIQILQPCFIENTGTDVIIEGSEDAVADPLGGGNFTGIVPHGSHGITIHNPWLEVYRNANSGSSWEVGQPTKAEFFRIGATGATAVARPTFGVEILNATVHGSADTDTYGAISQSLVRMKYAEGVTVDGVSFENNTEWPIVITEDSNTTLVSNNIVQTGRFDVRNVNRRELTTMPAAISVGDAPASTAMYSRSQRGTIISNPSLIGATSPLGWATVNAAIASYAVTGDEKSLGGTPVTITPSATNGRMQQVGIRLRARTCYEVIIRYKTSAASGTWQLNLNPDPTGAGIPSRAWYRELTAQTSFREYRFFATTYDAATITSTARLALQYLGSTFTDTITVDYIDVIEVTPFDSGVRGLHRETFAASNPGTGTWAVGDIVWNTAPASGTNVGWVCTTAGTPGSWRQWGYPQISAAAPSFTSIAVAAGSAIGPSIRISSEASLGFYVPGAATIALVANNSAATLQLNQSRVLSMRTLAASALTVSAGNTNFRANECAFTIGGASGASFAIHSGGTIYIFESSKSAAIA